MLQIFKIDPEKDFDEMGMAIKDKKVYVKVNKKVYRKESVISAAYSIQEFANVIIDESEDYYIIALSTKDEFHKLEELGFEFNNRIINYENYYINLEKTKEIKQKLLSQVYSQLPEEQLQEEVTLESADYCEPEEDTGYGEKSEIEESEDLVEEDFEEIDDEIDINDIIIPWEEKFKNELEDKNDVYLEIDNSSNSEESKEIKNINN